MFADVKADVKQQVYNIRTGSSILKLFIRSTFKT